MSASDGQALIYDSSTNQWKPSTLASSAYASGVAFNSSGNIMGNGNEVYTSWTNNPDSSESAIRSDTESGSSGSSWVGQQFTHASGYFYPAAAGTYLVSAHANFLRDGDPNMHIRQHWGFLGKTKAMFGKSSGIRRRIQTLFPSTVFLIHITRVRPLLGCWCRIHGGQYPDEHAQNQFCDNSDWGGQQHGLGVGVGVGRAGLR